MNGHRQMNTTSSRILTDVPCKVCNDNSSGKHYGIFACDGCAGFFKRSIRRNRQYVCKNHGIGNCPVDKTHRNQCRSCRLTRCLEAGMNKEAVQHERGPRNSTIRRQMALLLKESSDLISAYHQQHSFHQRPHPHPVPATFHHPLSSSSSSSSTNGIDYSNMSTNSSIIHPTPKYPLDLRTSIIEHQFDAHESAARILFNAINWAKTVPAFVSLSNHDQLSLLEEGWRDLFILTAAEQQFSLNITDLLNKSGKHENLKSDIEYFQDLLIKFKHMEIDSNEFICLKSLVLFKTVLSNCQTMTNPQLQDVHSIAYLQDQAQILLNTYINKQYPSQPYRFGKLIHLLAGLRSISSLTIEELFFRKTIGDKTHMEQLVKDMYQINMANIVANSSLS
ncbi:unnamed protein product [Rotaria socialis]|uniref:Uncharacterized protein n=2 Tax=Rotaria socialis TaxID=392032 RepID=A0A818BSZ4_9BILA|nr:unnamed protein product [Rotaria socialis]CAF3371399.1 unnamed protein product [Rotaria socialis]CAF3419479.1 unnamed protein product [Rotaria socialis]CAF3438907.1 unnamed protein product [Rotaria socialis]CAF3516514.1 unnamed protein product [Rotaria socialis]